MFGTLPAMALIATAIPGSAQAQIRGRVPTVIAPERQGPVIRRRTPAAETTCPDPIQARRDGRSVPAGCPGAQEEQAPVAVQYREQSGETPASTERESRPVAERRPRNTADTPLADQPVNDGRVRRRIPTARTPADDEVREAAPDRPAPVRRRGDYVARTPDEIAPPREITPDRPPPIRRRSDDVARTPDEVGPPREITPDRPPPIRRRDDYVARTPDEVDSSEPTPVRPGPIRRRDGVVATPDEDAGRSRVFPRRDRSYAGDELPPTRPVRPVTGGNLAGTPAGGIAGQVDCILPRPPKTLTNVDVTHRMLCGFPGPGKPMTFRFQPAHWYAVEAAYADGFAARISFGEPVGGVYPTIAVAEGRQARATMVCVPLIARFNDGTSLVVGKRGEEKTSYRLWCTADGKVVMPIELGWFDNSMITALLFETPIEDGPIEVGYFHVTTPFTLDTVSQLDTYPRVGTAFNDTTAIADRNKVDNEVPTATGLRLTYAEPPLTGRVLRCANSDQEIKAGNCIGTRRKANGQAETIAFRAYAPPAALMAARRPAKYEETKSVSYTLMPGIIPVQYRGEAGGACRISIVQVAITPTPHGQGEGHADEDGAYFQAQQEQGRSSGVASGYVAPQPLADDCN